MNDAEINEYLFTQSVNLNLSEAERAAYGAAYFYLVSGDADRTLRLLVRTMTAGLRVEGEALTRALSPRVIRRDVWANV